MIKVEYINAKEEVSFKIKEYKTWLADKATTEYAAYVENGGKALTARDKVLDGLKVHDPKWSQKEGDLKFLETKHSTMNFALETLQKMISTVSAGYMTVEEYNQWSENYSKFFEV